MLSFLHYFQLNHINRSLCLWSAWNLYLVTIYLWLFYILYQTPSMPNHQANHFHLSVRAAGSDQLNIVLNMNRKQIHLFSAGRCVFLFPWASMPCFVYCTYGFVTSSINNGLVLSFLAAPTRASICILQRKYPLQLTVLLLMVKNLSASHDMQGNVANLHCKSWHFKIAECYIAFTA